MGKCVRMRSAAAKMLVLLLIIGMMGNAGNVHAEDAKSVEAVDIDVTEVDTPSRERAENGAIYEKKLFKDNDWTGGKPDSKAELENGATVSFADKLIIQYFFELSPENVAVIANKQEKTYTLTCPEGLRWSEGNEIDIEFTNEAGETVKFATLRQEPGEGDVVTASLTFVDDLQDVAEDGIENIFVYLGCQLDEGAMKDLGEPEKYDIKLSEEETLTVSIAENQPKTSALTEKKGEYKNGTFTWMLTYQPGRKEADLPLTLVDEFDSTYHDYKEGSFKVIAADGSETADGSQDFAIERDAKNKVTRITYQIPEEISKGSDPVTVTYDTTLTDEGLTSTSGRKVTNTARLINSQGQKVGGDVNGSATFQKIDWLQKESVGGLQKKGDGRKYLTWKVTVKTNSKNLDKLILHDQLQNGTEYAAIDRSSIRIMAYRNGQQESDETSGYNHKVEENSNNGFDLTFNTGDLADQYVVTYNTDIVETYFYGENKDTLKNQATLDYGWYRDGDEGGVMFEPEPPTVTQPTDVDGRIITKAGAGYDPSTHEITWRVAVNPYGLNLSEIRIEDPTKISGYEQTYVPGSFRVENSTVTGVVTEPAESDPAGKLIIYFAQPGTETFAYTFKTTVDDPKMYAYNLEKKDYINTVNATMQLNQGNGDTKELTASATGTQSIRSNVLQKKAEGYDYTDHTIGWCITVNENKMPMKSDAGILLEDTLAKGLAYVDGSLEVTKEITGADGTARTEAYDRIGLTYSANTEGKQVLTFQFPEDAELTEKLYIRFRTKADVDQIAGFKENNSFNISNAVILKRNGYFELSASANQKMDNKILAKSGKYEKDQGTITYTVNLNPHGITLDNTIVRDELPEGLQIDKDTIRLYQAAIDKNGVFTKDKAVNLTGLLAVNMLERWFEIKLPTGTTPYVLEYVTDVTDITQTSFSNKISLNGTVSGGAGQGGTDVGLGSGGGGGGGTASPKVNLTLKKVDAMRPEVKLQGAVFRISDEDGPINEITTDAEGKAIFRYLKRGKTYIIEEITPPTGYRKMEGTITIPIDDETPKQYEYLVTNQPVTGSISFEVKNQLNKAPIAGVAMGLWRKPQGAVWAEVKDTEPYRTVQSDADGVVCFDGLPAGDYWVYMLESPDEYELEGHLLEVSITFDQVGEAVIKIIDSETGEEIKDGIVDIIPEGSNKPEPDPEETISRPGLKPEAANNDGNINYARESQSLLTGDNTPWVKFLAITLLSGVVIIITVLYCISMKKRKESDR